MNFNENINPKMNVHANCEHIIITELESGKEVANFVNDIHYENMAVAIAESLSNQNGFIKELVIGVGGCKINSLNEIQFFPTQTLGSSATLYNEVYSKIVDQKNPNNIDPTQNHISVSHVDGRMYANITVRMVLTKGEPSGQGVVNKNKQILNEFSFNEIGLRTYNNSLITHAIFNPITKASNISLLFDYLLKIQLV